MAKKSGLLDHVTSGGGDFADTLLSTMKRKQVTVPAVLAAAGTVAATRGPKLLRGVGEKVAEGAGGTKKKRRLPIQGSTDVALPLEQAYGSPAKVDELPRFIHRVLRVEQHREDTLGWA